MIIAIEATDAQLNLLRNDPGYTKIMKENPNAVIIICQNNTVRILHDASGKGNIYNRPSRVLT